MLQTANASQDGELGADREQRRGHPDSRDDRTLADATDRRAGTETAEHEFVTDVDTAGERGNSP
jgi:hypothetical protein